MTTGLSITTMPVNVGDGSPALILSSLSEKQAPNTVAMEDPGIAAALVPSTRLLSVAEPLAIGAASLTLLIVVESSIVVLL